MTSTDVRWSDSAKQPRRQSIISVVLAVMLVVLGFASTASASVRDSSGTDPSDTTTAPPATDAPNDTAADDTLVPSGETTQEEDEGLDVAPLAIVGFVILLAIASWWMVRRDDDDDKPSPPPAGEPQWRADQIAP